MRFSAEHFSAKLQFNFTARLLHLYLWNHSWSRCLGYVCWTVFHGSKTSKTVYGDVSKSIYFPFHSLSLSGQPLFHVQVRSLLFIHGLSSLRPVLLTSFFLFRIWRQKSLQCQVCCMSTCVPVGFNRPWGDCLLNTHTQNPTLSFSLLHLHINSHFILIKLLLHRHERGRVWAPVGMHGCVAVAMLTVQSCRHPDLSRHPINSITFNSISQRREQRRLSCATNTF